MEQELSVRFHDRLVKYHFGRGLASLCGDHYKSQGSEFPEVVMPVAMQHYIQLQRNLIYHRDHPSHAVVGIGRAEEGSGDRG
jgi:exodeoxyribonuclease V alpha subunit